MECTLSLLVPVKPSSNVLKDATKEFIYIFSDNLSFVKDTQSLLVVLRERSWRNTALFCQRGEVQQLK